MEASHSSVSEKFNDKVEKAISGWKKIEKVVKQIEKLDQTGKIMSFDYKVEMAKKEKTKNSLKELSNRFSSTQEKANSRLKKLTKQRGIDHAVLYVVQHPQLLSDEAVCSEKLFVLCWEAKSYKNLGMMLDMLIEYNIVLNSSELDDIVSYFISQGLNVNEKVHEYMHYLLLARGYKVSAEIWQEYTKQVLENAKKCFENVSSRLPTVTSDVAYYSKHLQQLHKNLIENEEQKLNDVTHFEELLDVTFRQLRECLYKASNLWTYSSQSSNLNIQACANECINSSVKQASNEEMQKCMRNHVFRPLFLAMLTNKFSFQNLTRKNEYYTSLLVDEMVVYGCENAEMFKGVFLKLGFKDGLMPWSVFKGIKEELKTLDLDILYFYVTKFFLDNFSDNEEVCEYIFTNKEYKDLIKHFLDECNELKEEDGFRINENNEPEFDGFVIVD